MREIKRISEEVLKGNLKLKICSIFFFIKVLLSITTKSDISHGHISTFIYVII